MALHLVRDDEPEVITDVPAALQTYEIIDAQIKSLTKARDTIKVQILGAMAFQAKKRVEATSAIVPGRKFRATYTVPERLKVDAKGIQEALSTRRFAQVSDRVLNPEKLMSLVDKGLIQESVISPFVSKVKGEPQVRFFLIEEKEEDAGRAEDEE